MTSLRVNNLNIMISANEEYPITWVEWAIY